MLNLESVSRPDADYIRTMFDRMARRYDTFTFWMSFGGAARMRAEALKDLRPGDRVLDVACGTGDLALEASRRVGATGRVTGLDFSSGMLEVAELRRKKLGARCPAPIVWVCRGAETLPLLRTEDGADAAGLISVSDSADRTSGSFGILFDRVVSGFALRGLYANIDQILDGIRESLVPGGRIALLDLTEPRNAFLRALYKTFFFSYVAFLGAVLFGKDYPVAYLPDSSSRFLKADDFVEKLKARGFTEVTARSFVFGAVTLYEGRTASGGDQPPG
jgi:ubiquinone/menaquinone biosynthesis C-methylase UbiE